MMTMRQHGVVALGLWATMILGACGGSSGGFLGNRGDGGARLDGAAASDGGGCLSDRDCSPMVPRCDKNASRCVPCLPQADNCPPGTRCQASGGSFTCSNACVNDGDCPRSDGGGVALCCGGACVDSARDIDHCGGCGKSCPAPANGKAACTDGACTIGECTRGFADCDKMAGNGCESTAATDVSNCGVCGTVCPGGPHQSAACKDGACASTCAPGFAHCSMNSADGCEVDVSADLKNCGGCGKVCGALANGTPGCAAGSCVAVTCNPGFADCNKKFDDGCEVTLATDIAHCGACGKPCPAIANGVAGCKAGSCVIASCNAGFADCDGVANNGCEVDTRSDARNCGGCGGSCGGANSTQSCAAGVCVISACAPGFADCDRLARNGCEVSTGNDPANCGGCGNGCAARPNATSACANAQCVIGACSLGFGDCNMSVNDGCEADLGTIAACGACNIKCAAPANGTAACKGGMCGLGACNPGFADCDANPANGCERNLNTDVINCGQCSVGCSNANGVGACVGGVCTIQSCNPGFGDCNMSANDGCEKSLGTDVNNCGACGKVCSFVNGVGACAAGVCVLQSCNGGYGDCDGMAANGCELKLAADPKNCGVCGRVCGVNTPTCIGGACFANTYLPVGPQTNVPIANLVGWTQCFLDTYGDVNDPTLAQIQAACSKARLMLACRPAGSQTLTLLAQAPRADVLFNIGDGSSTPHNANGTGWYYSTAASWGFALQGDVINRNLCDIKASALDATGGNGNLRLCYHTAASKLDGGWRCGTADGLNASAAWERVIYHAD